MHCQTFFFCLDLNFKEKPLVKPHHFTDRTLTKLATFVIILVATFFFYSPARAFYQFLWFASFQGQNPLNPSELAAASPQDQKQMLGERLFPLIQATHPDQAGKITGMLLEIDNAELLHMLESREALHAKTQEAVSVLRAHSAKEKSAEMKN